jgi:hypothetical protein
MKKILIIVLSSLVLFSCDQETERLMPASTGSPGHILIVMAKEKWKYGPGEIVRETFNQDYEILPQSEPIFDYSQIPVEAYSKLLKRTRNILFADITVNAEKPEVLIAYDKYASPQIIITVRAKNNEEFKELFTKYAEKIVFSYEKAERNRLLKVYQGKLEDHSIKNKLEKKHKLRLSIPKGYKLDVNNDDFAWISRETPWSTQALLIWHYPYTDTSQLHLESLMNKRDEMTRKNVPGPADSTYMTSERIIDPEFSEFLLNNTYTAEVKGLWKVTGKEGVFMGGPFVSFNTVDTKRNRIITVDGFVYGGKKDKRELMRQVKAIMYTLKPVE